MGQEFEIKTRATHNERSFSTRLNFLDDGQGEFTKAVRIECFARIKNRVEVVGCFVLFFVVRRSRDGLEPTIKLKGVSIDDFAI